MFQRYSSEGSTLSRLRSQMSIQQLARRGSRAVHCLLFADVFSQEKEADNDDETTPREQEPASTARLNVADLGFYDPVDTFWNRRVDFDQATLSRSAQDLLEELDQSTTSTSCGPQGLGSSDAVSYEDLMEFALDGPRHRSNHAASLFLLNKQVK